MSDDELKQVLRRVMNRVDRKACAQVSKQWRRVEGATRTSLRVLDPDAMPSFLPRFTDLLSLHASWGLSDSHLSFIAASCPNLHSLNLNARSPTPLHHYQPSAVGDHGLLAISAACKDLARISLRWRQSIADPGVASLANGCPTLAFLDLAHCHKVTDMAVDAIAAASSSLQVLVLKGCTLITDRALSTLASCRLALTLIRLDLSECDQLTDTGIGFLQRLIALQVINLAECGPRITDIGGLALSSMASLQRLNLSWLVNISDSSLVAIAEHCRDLQELNVSGCEMITGVGICAFSHHKALQSLTLSSCYNVFSEHVDEMAMQCSTLQYLGLDRALRHWIPVRSLQIIESRCTIEWL